jgi:hypothetical protein
VVLNPNGCCLLNDLGAFYVYHKIDFPCACIGISDKHTAICVLLSKSLFNKIIVIHIIIILLVTIAIVLVNIDTEQDKKRRRMII